MSGFPGSSYRRHVKCRCTQPTGRAKAAAFEIVKDPYVFDFLDPAERSRECAIETVLTERLQDTLTELGPGFAFVGKQVHFAVDGDEPRRAARPSPRCGRSARTVADRNVACPAGFPRSAPAS